MSQSRAITRISRKATQSLTIAMLAIGLLAGASRSFAVTNVWTASSGDFNSAGNWNPAQSPATGDSTLFTNDSNYTISFSSSSPVLDNNIFSNHAGVATLNIGGNTWTVTNNFFVGRGDATSTVYLASGTLRVAGTANSAAILRIADATTNLVACPSCRTMGALIVTNGTVVIDAGIVGANSNGVGKLVITGPSTVTFGVSGSTLTIGNASSGSQLIVTNGGNLLVDGTLTIGTSAATSNNSAIFSGPTSRGTFTAAGYLKVQGNSCQLIVTNGAKISMTGSLLFGNASSFSTGVVVGAGTSLILEGSAQFGTGSAGATNNFFMVSNGGFFSCGGTFAYGNNAFNVNNGIQIGGPGLMSTAVTYFCRSASNATNHEGNFLTITNAVLTSGLMLQQGPQETLSVLANGTWLFTNSFSLSTGDGPVTQDCIQVRGPGSLLIINRGTLSNLRVGGDNGGGITIGGSTLSIGTSLVVTNGGKLLSSFGTIGGNGIFTTGIVAGVGSVWSNFMGEAGFTNGITVGANTGGSNSFNFFGVLDGGRLYNDGILAIGGNATNTLNTVQFGGPGASVVVDNTGSLNIGSTAGTYSNKLIVTNATLTCGALNVGNTGATNNALEFRGGTIAVTVSNMVVRPTNTVIFAAGTLSVVGMRYDTLANPPGTNAFVVGNGTSAAYYDMVAGGSGLHNFNDGGLVVTNGAYLRGNGALAGKVTVLGTFVPGFSVGSIVTSNTLQFGPSAVLNYDLGTSSDSVTVYGSLVLGGTLNVASSGGFGAGTYVLFTHTNVVSGTLTVGSLPSGFAGTISNDLPNTPRILLVVTSTGGGGPYSTWASFYGLSGGNAAGAADPDGDGMSNTNEFLAGFNPNNSAARLHIINIAKAGTNVTINYLGASGDSNGSPGPKTNVLDFTTGTPPSFTNNFVSTGLTNILTGNTGLGTVATFVHTNGATGPARYYRVRVLLP